MTVTSLLAEMTSEDVMEWMAFDMLKDKKYMDRIKSENMTEEERTEAFKRMLGKK